MSAPRRVIAITGAGGALGAAISHRLASEPATDLVVSDLSESSLAETVDGLGAVETVLAEISPAWIADLATQF